MTYVKFDQFLGLFVKNASSLLMLNIYILSLPFQIP